MNVLFVPTLGLDTSLLSRLAASVDFPVKWKVAYNNGPEDALEHFQDTHPDWIIKEPAVGNRGVAGSWNDCAKMFPYEPTWLIMNDDAWFLPGYLEQICKTADANLSAPVVHMNDTNAYYSFVWSAEGRKTFGEFDENFWPAYCLAPDTLILKDDLRWSAIGSLKPGDGLVGVEENRSSPFGRRYIQSNVLSTSRRSAPSVRIIFEDNREVICSLDHKWLAARPRPSSVVRGGYCWKWVPSSNLSSEWVVYAPLRTWEDPSTFDEGWLAGALDGEGSFQSARKGLQFYQNAGVTLEHFKNLISKMGIRYSIHCDSQHDRCFAIHISIKRHAIELMGRLRPVRFIGSQRRLWENVHVRSKFVRNDLPIRHIESVGRNDVVSIETTSHTFIANGIISHNCEDCDMRVRHRLGGVRKYPYALEGLSPLPHGKPKTGGINYSALIQGTGLLNRTYWIRKWGSPDCENTTYETPYKDHRLTLRDVVWDPAHRAKLYPLWEAFINQPTPSIYE